MIEAIGSPVAEDGDLNALNLSFNSFKPIVTKKAGAINYELEVNA